MAQATRVCCGVFFRCTIGVQMRITKALLLIQYITDCKL